MKTLIFLPGAIDDVFFEKEMKYINKYFDKVFVISYAGDNALFESLSQKYGFEYKTIKPFSVTSSLKLLNKGWFKLPHVKDEFNNQLGASHHFFKKLYAGFYGLFAIEAKPLIQEVIDNSDGEVYLYSYWLSRPAYVLAMMNEQRNPKVKAIVSRAHGFDIYKERNKYGYLPFRSFINSNMDEISFVTNHGMQYFNKNWPDTDNLIKRVLYLGSENCSSDLKEIKNKNVPVIATTSYVRGVKRYDLIIEVLSKLKSDFIWYQYGEGEDITKIKELAESKLTGKKFDFRGSIPNKELLNRYLKDDVDFLLNLSDSEGLPVTYMEAMSLGIPVLARDVGGSSEMVNESNGVLLKNEPDTDAWARIIDQELNLRVNDSEGYKYKSGNAFKTWSTKFNSDQNIDDFLKDLSESDFVKN